MYSWQCSQLLYCPCQTSSEMGLWNGLHLYGWMDGCEKNVNLFCMDGCTVFVPLAAQGAYQSHFRWALIKTLISWFFSLKLVTFEKKKSMENNLEETLA